MAPPIIIDCDPGLDDAVAIALAAASPRLAVEAITTVAGNAPIEVVTRNALAVREALGLDAPVYRGSARPLIAKPHYSTMLWGGDGDLGLPPPTRSAGDDAVGFLGDVLATGSKIVCPVGPLSNIARLIGNHPAAAGKIERLVVMGGALGRGNASPHAELNIWFDPHAAAKVFDSGVPLTLVPLDVTRTVVVKPDRIKRLSEASTPVAKLCARLLPLSGRNSHPSSIHDACAVGWLLWPELFRTEDGRLSVVLDGEEAGRTLFAPGKGPHRVATSLDVKTFLDRLVETLCGRT